MLLEMEDASKKQKLNKTHKFVVQFRFKTHAKFAVLRFKLKSLKERDIFQQELC